MGTYINCRPHTSLLNFLSQHLRPAAYLEVYVPWQQRTMFSLCLHSLPCLVATRHKAIVVCCKHMGCHPLGPRRVWVGDKDGVWCMESEISCPFLPSKAWGGTIRRKRWGVPMGRGRYWCTDVLSSGTGWFPVSQGKSCYILLLDVVRNLRLRWTDTTARQPGYTVSKNSGTV